MVHKKGKWVTESEKRIVHDLLGRGKKSVRAIAEETEISRSKVYEIKQEFEPLQPILERIQNICAEGVHDYKTPKGDGSVRTWLVAVCQFCGKVEY